MKKIAILGCENSHADMFLDFIKEDAKYADIKVIGVYSHDADAAQKLSETYGVAVLENYAAAVGEVDGVIITARHGDNHYKYAKPYIEKGIPMFIDKPITIDGGEAVSFMRECQSFGVRVTGGSCCIHDEWVQKLKRDREENEDGETLGGFVRCPVAIGNPNGGFFFYSQHLVETVGHIFGRYPKSVKAYQNGAKLAVVFRYDTFEVVGLFTDNNFSCYYAMRASEHHMTGAEFPIKSKGPCFRAEFDEYYKLLMGGEQKISYKDFIAPVFVLNAIFRSMQSGNEEKVEEYEV